MDPGTIINVVALVLQLLDLVRGACKDSKTRRKRFQDELHRFEQELDEHLQFANNIKEQAGALDFKSTSLDILQNELQKCVSSAKDLLSRNNCKKEDIQQLREHAMRTLQERMGRILIEMCLKTREDVKAIKEMLAKKQEMLSKNDGMQINIFQGQAHGNSMLKGMLETFLCRVLDEHLNLVVPTKEAGPYVRVADVGMNKGVEESGRKVGAGKDVLEEKKRRKEALVWKEDMERMSAEKDVPKEEEYEKDKKKKEVFLTKKGLHSIDLAPSPLMALPLPSPTPPPHPFPQRQDDEEQDNSNCNMEFEGKGELLMSKLEGSHIEMTYAGHEEFMGMVIRNTPMEVSGKLGYCYFEVKLVEMADWETGLAGVGVGLARSHKFRTSKMAGKYSKSCGYDGRVGEVYYENRVKEGPSRMGFLAMGDTLGIGLLKHHGQHHIFFAKNRELRVCFQVDSLCAPSSHGDLYPVISLASAFVRLHVNFQGPFELSELLVLVKAHK